MGGRRGTVQSGMTTRIPIPCVTIRYDTQMRTCGRCGTTFMASGRRRYCSDACKQADWRAPIRVHPLWLSQSL
jgi:ribosomal protein S27AE